MSLSVTWFPLNQSNRLVAAHHRHNKPARGCAFSLAAWADGQVVGVAIVGRPVSPELQQQGGFQIAEVTRCCALPGAPLGTCSFLYGRAWRIWQAMGGRRMVTYTLASESGASLRGAGWRVLGEKEPIPEGQGWTNRPGREWQPVQGELRLRWEAPA